MVTRAGAAATGDTQSLTATLPPTENGPRNEADPGLFLERISRGLVMLKYEGK